MGFAAPAAPFIIGGSAAAGGITSAMGARRQNETIEATRGANRRALVAQQQQLVDESAFERRKRLDAAASIRGRMRTASGEAGVGVGGSAEALLRQNDFDAALAQAAINRNLGNVVGSVRSQWQAQDIGLQAGRQDPIMSAFAGTIAGMETGLSIVNMTQQLAKLGELKKAPGTAGGQSGVVTL